jgi:hypothetical protein
VHGRIPIWVGGRWPRKKPLERAQRWQGYFPVETQTPDDVRAMRAVLGDAFPVIVAHGPDEDPAPWFEAGATWCLTDFGPEPSLEAVTRAIDAGP